MLTKVVQELEGAYLVVLRRPSCNKLVCINFVGRISASICYVRSAEFLALNCVLWEPSALCILLLEKK